MEKRRRSKIERTASEERQLAEDRKKRRTELQKQRRERERELCEPGPSSSNLSQEIRQLNLQKDREHKKSNRLTQSSVNEFSYNLDIKQETVEEYNSRLENINQQRRQSRHQETEEGRNSRLERRRHQQAQRNIRNAYKMTDLTQIEVNDVGEMNLKCSSCKGKHFLAETHDKNMKFSACCEKGKVHIPPQNNFPQFLKDLYKNENVFSNEFKSNIRGYMKALSMASIITKEIKFNGGGPYTYRQVGEFQKKFNVSAHPNPDELPTFGQLFMIEADEACGIRYNIVSHLNQDLLFELDSVIRSSNPFAQSYTMLKDEMQKARNDNQDLEYKLLFCLKDHLDKRRFNPPRVNEVAVLFEQGVDGEVPRYEVCVNEHGKKHNFKINPSVF